MIKAFGFKAFQAEIYYYQANSIILQSNQQIHEEDDESNQFVLGVS